MVIPMLAVPVTLIVLMWEPVPRVVIVRYAPSWNLVMMASPMPVVLATQIVRQLVPVPLAAMEIIALS